ncbi:MAG: hypothetical protein U0175_10535 [Caldilineaceae bacterium]
MIELRPQPVGIFSLPVSYLLLPPAPNGAVAHRALLAGKIPEQWPDAWQFYALALAGDLDGAWSALAPESSALASYNRFVLRSSPEEYSTLKGILPCELQPLLDTVAYTLGYLNLPPAHTDATNEILALLLMTQASACLEQEDSQSAIQLLQAASQAASTASPILAALLQGAMAEAMRNQQGATPQLIQLYQCVIGQLKNSDLEINCAEFTLGLGSCYHELANGQRGALMEAVRYYQEALQVLTRENAPELYALAHNNLALAYLAMPMNEASDQLRMGIAVQSLREALKIYNRQQQPELWSSAQLNLANALQHLPSSHPEDNLVEAVERYEDLLSVRSRADDPIGFARLLANQGNALAHLGIYEHATPKLNEALNLFSMYGHGEEAGVIADLLREIEMKHET